MNKLFKSLLIIFIVALSGGLASCEAQQSEVNTTEEKTQLIQLPQPTNLHVSDDLLVWDEISQVDFYSVDYDGTEEIIGANYYYLPELSESATVIIRVRALGDGKTYADSEWAEFTYTYFYEKPTESLVYTLLPDGSGYEVSRKYINPNTGLDERIIIPDYYNGLPVKRIADEAFMYVGELDIADPFLKFKCNEVTKSIVLPSHLESIGKNAFGCILNLEEIVIPDSVTQIGALSFYGCMNLKRVTLSKNLKVLPTSCFMDCALEELTLPYGLEEIEKAAFRAETRIFINSTSITANQCFTKLVIPETVTKIGEMAFCGCFALEDITFPETLQLIDRYAFDGTSWLDNQPDGPVTINGDILYLYKGVMLPEGSVLEIPSEINYIAGGAFENQKYLEGVVFHDGIKLIGTYLFLLCTSLSWVRLPSDLQEIPEGCFSGCNQMYSIVIPESVTVIGLSAFSNCYHLIEVYNYSSLNVTAGSTDYGELGLYALSVHTSSDEKSNITTTDDGFIFYDDGASLYLIGTSIKTGDLNLPDYYNGRNYGIYNYAFCYKQQITSITLGSGVTSIGEAAFMNCTSLTNLVINSGVTFIGDRITSRCSSITGIYYAGSEDEWNAITTEFTSIYNNAVTYLIRFYSESEPELNENGTAYNGNYWHYVDGEIVEWTLS